MEIIKKINLMILIGLMLFSFIPFNLAEDTNNETTLHFFYGKGCPHCASGLKFLDSLESKYSSLKIEKHETYFNQTERELFEEMTSAFGERIEGVPTTFVDNKIIVGFSDSIANSIEEEIKNCIEKGCENPIDKIKDNETMKLIGDKTTAFEKLTIPAVVSAAIVDAINPCAFAVLIILVSTILISSDRKKALLAGLAFSLSIFISYFLMGIGLYSAIQASGLSHNFYLVVAILAIFIGIFNLKDYLWYGKFFVMEVPKSWRPKMKSLIGGITSVPGAFAMGFVISLFLLPCTSGPYIVILGLLAKATTKSYALILLVFYNLIFILPMILITLAIFFGLTTTKKAERLRKKKLKILHLIAGIIILCLGIGMLFAIKLGMI
jgi:cytochrome c biogenesis protein CcdA/glutaredoxin